MKNFEEVIKNQFANAMLNRDIVKFSDIGFNQHDNDEGWNDGFRRQYLITSVLISKKVEDKVESNGISYEVHKCIVRTNDIITYDNSPSVQMMDWPWVSAEYALYDPEKDVWRTPGLYTTFVCDKYMPADENDANANEIREKLEFIYKWIDEKDLEVLKPSYRIK